MKERNEQIVNLRRQGVLIREICKITGVSKNTVIRVLRDAGIEYHRTWYDNAENLSLEELTPLVIEQYENGHIMREIAETYGMRVDAVRKILKSNGVSPSGKLLAQGITSPEARTEAILELREQGLTYDQIVSELGICKTVVYRTCKSAGKNRPTPKENPELEEQITSLYLSGVPAKAIRNEVHKSYEYVQKILKKHGLIKSGKEKRDERNQEILRLKNEGVSAEKIAEQVGINKFSVYHIIKQMKDTPFEPVSDF